MGFVILGLQHNVMSLEELKLTAIDKVMELNDPNALAELLVHLKKLNEPTTKSDLVEQAIDIMNERSDVLGKPGK